MSTTPAPGVERVRVLHEQGIPPRRIAAALDISTQRVHQCLKVIRREDDAKALAEKETG